jgi:hypothetical protein
VQCAAPLAGGEGKPDIGGYLRQGCWSSPLGAVGDVVLALHLVEARGGAAEFSGAVAFRVLVHEAMYVPALETYIRGEIAKGRPVRFEDVMAHMKADHTPVGDVGRIAQEAGVKTLVLSHLVPATDGITDDTWRSEAAKYFKGEIIVGKDLMVI